MPPWRVGYHLQGVYYFNSMKTIEQLQIELDEANELIKEKESEIEELNGQIEELEEEIFDHICEDNYPKFNLMVDEQKHELFMESYSLFSLEQFESFVKQFKKI